ncbi:unnamed protein product [Linum trigynum]|uniref:Uncharacterized protein n=1 Tax=Linum trigynum TaxID=586398 RepID=A0AAV2D1A6_9ROSI
MWASSISILPSTPLVSPTTLIKLTVPTKPAGFPAAPRCRSSYAVPAKAQETEDSTAGDEKQGTPNQLRGLDVLLAMQKVAAVKSKVKNRKRIGQLRESPPPSGDEEASTDYSNVRPVRVKKEWSAKLDDLEKRLRRLSSEET